jgi:hypothetical protein
MKTRGLLLLIILAFYLSSCKKNNDNNVTTSNLLGKWELERRYGGFIRPTDTTYKPGNGNILQFGSDSTFKQYVAGQLINSGTYQVLKGAKTPGNPAGFDRLNFDHDTTDASLIHIADNLLTIQPLIPDEGTTQYRKLAN